jgi:cytokinin dehydrogenase
MAGTRLNRNGLVELQARLSGRVTEVPEVLEEASRDFGGLVRRRPGAVVRPRTDEDVVTALRVAIEHGLSVSVRGSGHSQSGQCVGGDVVMDMRALDRIVRVSDGGDLVEVEAGARWKDVVDATFRRGRLPLGLTHVLDTTVAGTLSVGGVGAESFRVGPQVDNALFLDVATPDGSISRCSLNEHRDLFDAVRAGLGQCGVIVRVGYPARACRSRVQSRWFVFRNLERFMRGISEVTSDVWASFVSGVLARDPRDHAKFVLVLVLGREYDQPKEVLDDRTVATLEFDEELPVRDAPLWHSSGIPGHVFFRLFAPNPGSLDADPTTFHPWIDHIFDRDAAASMLREHLDGKLPILTLGTNALIFIRRARNAAPLFVAPQASGLLWGLGMFPSLPPHMAAGTLPGIVSYARHGQILGGKRYLSGYLDFADASDWAEHYGREWTVFSRAKKHFDPLGVLNPGCVAWG